MKKGENESVGVPMDQTQIDAWLTRYKALMRDKPAGEATISSRRQQINLLEREVAGFSLHTYPSLLPARAKMAMMLGKSDSAIKIWQEHARLNPKNTVAAALNIADIHLRKNDAAAARRTLDTVADCNEPLYYKIQAQLKETEDFLEASALYIKALKNFERGKREKFCDSTLSALSLLHGDAISKHPQIVALIEDLSFACTKKRPAKNEEINLPDVGKGPNPVALFAAGFGWSGSGAVFDFLRQHKLAEPFSTRELSFLGAGEGDILKCLVAIERKPKTFNRLLAATICVGVLGLSGRSDKGVSHLLKAKARSLLFVFAEDSEKLEKLIIGARRFTRRCIQLDIKDSERIPGFVGATREFFEYVLKLKQGTGRFLLFSNAVSGPGLEVIRALPESNRVIATVRDIRDAYADRYLAGKQWDAKTFIRSYNGKRGKYERSIQNPEVSKKVIQVQFEKLVLDQEYRRNLLIQLDMDPDLVNEDGEHFNPEESAKNIGMHSYFEDSEAIDLISNELNPYLFNG